MERKKHVVPGEVCAARLERGNHYFKVVLNAQKSAEVIVAKMKQVFIRVKDRINRSLKYDRERRNDSL